MDAAIDTVAYVGMGLVTMPTLTDNDLLSYWSSYLEMLSMEGLSRHIDELGLPFLQEQFPDVLRAARACLETEMYCTEFARANASRSYFRDAWTPYHREMGVVSAVQLRELCSLSRGDSPLIAWKTFKGSQWLDEDISTGLIQWFEENYPTLLDETWRWPWAVRLFFNEKTFEADRSTPAPLSREETLQLKRFSIVYEAHKMDIEIRMYIDRIKAIERSHSTWENVRQRFPVDSEGATDHEWIRTIEACLQHRLIRREWTKLSDALGSQVLLRITNWIREQESSLPNAPSLPDPPRLLP